MLFFNLLCWSKKLLTFVLFCNICIEVTVTLQEVLADTLPKMAKLNTELYAKIFVMEKNEITAKFYVRDPEIIMDDSSELYTGTV